MRSFTDNAGRSWTVQINVDAIKRVRDLVQVNLLEIIEGKLIERLISDPILLCDVIYAVCKPQADSEDITDVDFGRAMAGDAIDGATTALLEDLVGFFPQARRQILSKALGKLRHLEQVVLDRAQSRLDSPKLEADLMRQLDALDEAPSEPSNSSGSVPASSDSTPAP